MISSASSKFRVVTVKGSGTSTMAEICAKEPDLTYSHGCGCYELKKKEKVSSGKLLVAWNEASSAVVEGGDAVRAQLKLPTGDAQISPSDIPSGWVLFVNSTSPNRGVPAGSRVLVKTASTGTSVPVKPIAEPVVAGAKKESPIKAAEKNTAARKRTREVDDDDKQDVISTKPTATVATPTVAVASSPSASAKTTTGQKWLVMHEKWWTSHDSVLLYPAHQHMTGSSKKKGISIAAFDMDDTLVKPKGGRTFAKSRDDWEWLCEEVPTMLRDYHNKGFCVVIISNQAGIAGNHTKAAPIQGKILDLCNATGIPISAALATEKDKFRKPEKLLWELVKDKLFAGSDVDMESSFYCGDAAGRQLLTLAGRKKDFSCGDRKFAYNAGLRFMTPEELFKSGKPAKFDWGVGPDDLKALPKNYPAEVLKVPSSPEVVVTVGFPGCGKSTYYKRVLAPKGYVQANRDILKTKEKCVATLKAALKEGKSVCVDNTSPQAEDRKLYIDAAKAAGVPVRCLHFTTSREMAEHFNFVRARCGGERVPTIVYNMFKSKFQEPTTKEGFSEVVKVGPTANFDALPPEVEEAFYQLSQ